MTATINEKKSILVQIMNEVDDFTQDEMNFILYWLKAKKNEAIAKRSDSSIIENTITIEDIYLERGNMRKEKSK